MHSYELAWLFAEIKSGEPLFQQVALFEWEGIFARNRKLGKVNMSARTQATLTPSTEPTAASAEAPSSTEPIANASRSPRTKPLFAMALVIVGTLPIGLGVGVAYRGRSVESNGSAACSAHNEASVHSYTASLKETCWKQFRADELFSAGNYGLALQHYQSKEMADSLRPSAELVLKIALCREALGQGEEALASLRSMSNAPDSDARAVALLAQSRIQLRCHEFGEARDMLGQILSIPEEGNLANSAVRGEASFLLAIASLSEGVTANSHSEADRPISSLDDSLWLVPQILMPGPPSSMDRLSEASELIAALLAEPSATKRQESGQRLAERLLASDPHHPLAGCLQLTLGEVAYLRGELAEAATRYREAIDKTSCAKSSVAAYNQGVVCFQLHEYQPAILTLGRFIDGAPEHPVRPRALLLRGRAFLETGDGKSAVFDLQRAADGPGEADVRAWATVFLGFAQLQACRPQLAAQNLFHRRDLVQMEPFRTAASFVVSLARLETLQSTESLDRETLFTLRALSKLDDQADWIGTSGRWTLGRAYQHLNMSEQAIELFEQALRDDASGPLAAELKLALADCHLSTGERDQAEKWLVDVRQNHRAPWSVNAGLRLAQEELSQGHHDECLAICRELLHCETNHAPIQRLMGKAHLLAGRDELAAECFAGLVKP